MSQKHNDTREKYFVLLNISQRIKVVVKIYQSMLTKQNKIDHRGKNKLDIFLKST